MSLILARRKLTCLLLLSLCGFIYHVPLLQDITRLWSTGHTQEHGLSTPSRLQQDEIQPVLGVFSAVFVVSLPARRDRRAVMERLRLALGIEWTYIDAISMDDPVVDILDACVRSSRARNRLRRFQWPSESELHDLVTHPPQLFLNNSSPWLHHSVSCHPLVFSLTPFPPHTVTRFDSTSTDILSTATTDLATLSRAPNPPFSSVLPLTCAVQDHVRGVRFKSSLPSYMLLTPPKLACWYSHLAAIRRFAAFHEANGNLTDAVLILEDDVDMEHDIRPKLQDLWGALPRDWDVVFLGHCWSDEAHHPPLNNLPGPTTTRNMKMTLHPSFAPKCTHAYVLSRSGARRVLLHILYSPFAYSRALDQAFAWLVQSGRIKAFSVVPSMVIQHKLYNSDIDGGEDGRGSGWKDNLEHGIITG